MSKRTRPDAKSSTDETEDPADQASTGPPEPWLVPIVFWLGVGLAVFHIWANTFATLPELTLSA